MSKPPISALLKAINKSSVLDAPVSAGVSNADAWPAREHESLKAALKKDKFFTDLMIVMQMNNLNLRRELSSIDSRERAAFVLKHEHAQTYKIDGTITNKGSLYSFERRLKKLKVLVVQHVRDCMEELKMVTSFEKNLFASDHSNSGAVSQDAVLREVRQLHTLVNSILAENLLVPGPKESTLIIEFVLKEHNLKKSKLKKADLRSIAQEAGLYKKALANMRELFTYYLLYAFGTLCQTETVDQLKVLQQQHFLSPTYRHAPDDDKPIFTAQIAIDYLKKECYTTNERTITALKRQLERVVRYNNESLFTFLNRFPALVNELEAAIGTTYPTNLLTNLWKLNFVKHMNRTEKQSIKIDHADYLTSAEWALIENFNEGIFDFAVMNKLLTQLCTTLQKWKADHQVRQWNDQRKKDFDWDHEVDYRAPAEVRSNPGRNPEDPDHKGHRGHRGQARAGRQYMSQGTSHDRKRHKSHVRNNSHTGHDNNETSDRKRSKAPSRDDRGRRPKKQNAGRSLLSAKSKIPFAKQCQEIGCKNKGVEGTHEWARCSHRNKSNNEKPENRGFNRSKGFEGFGKKTAGLNRDNVQPKSSFSKKKPTGRFKPSGKSDSQSRDRKCWNCGDPGHLSPNCPRQAKINHLLEGSEEFTCLLTEQFDTEELWGCAQRIINSHGKSICWACCKPACEANCTVESDPLSAFMPEAHSIMSRHPDLGASIQNAISQVDDKAPSVHYMAPLNHEMYYQSQEGQDTYHQPEDGPMNFKVRTFSESSGQSTGDERSPSEQNDERSQQESDSETDSQTDQDSKYNYQSDQEDQSSLEDEV
jgi:hypothetical protein